MPVARRIFVVAAATSLMVVLVFDRLRPGTPRRLGASVAMALLFAFGTAAWSTASRALWQHGPSMLLSVVALVLIQRLALADTGRHRGRLAAGAGVATALTYTVRPTNAIVVVGLSLYLVLRARALLVPYLAGAGAVAAAWVAVKQHHLQPMHVH